jgi:signal peptidase II
MKPKAELCQVNKTKKMSLRNSILIIAIILLVDQFVKIYIKTNFVYGEVGQVDVASWFKILLIENRIIK